MLMCSLAHSPCIVKQTVAVCNAPSRPHYKLRTSYHLIWVYPARGHLPSTFRLLAKIPSRVTELPSTLRVSGFPHLSRNTATKGRKVVLRSRIPFRHVAYRPRNGRTRTCKPLSGRTVFHVDLSAFAAVRAARFELASIASEAIDLTRLNYALLKLSSYFALILY